MNDLEKLQMVMKFTSGKPELKELENFCDGLWEKLDNLRSQGCVPCLKSRDRQEVDRLILILGIK